MHNFENQVINSIFDIQNRALKISFDIKIWY